MNTLKRIALLVVALVLFLRVDAQTVTRDVVEKTTVVTEVSKQEKVPVALKKVAIFVRNDSGKDVLTNKVKFLESTLAARLNNMGFGVISHDLAVRNLNTYLGDPNAANRSLAEKVKTAISKEGADAKLFASASGLRMAELIGADYIMTVSYASLGTEKKSFSGYGIQTENLLYNLRSNYSLAEGGLGTGTAGGVIKSSKSVRQTENMITESDDVLNELIEDTAGQMANLLKTQKNAGQIIDKENASGEITLRFVIEAMSFPELIKKDGEYIVGTNAIPATIPYVNAEIDGVTQTMGSTVSLSKGIHNLKINQTDIVPIERNIFVTGAPGQTISFTLSLTENARERWKKDMAFIQEMKRREKLTDAEVKKLEGIAEMYRNSGYKIDFKADAKELPKIENQQSIFGQ